MLYRGLGLQAFQIRKDARVDARKAIEPRIAAATTLEELFAALRAIEDEAAEMGRDPEAIYDGTSLPTFGGAGPPDTRQVWSWDARRLLVGERIADMRIVVRPGVSLEVDEEFKGPPPPHWVAVRLRHTPDRPEEDGHWSDVPRHRTVIYFSHDTLGRSIPLADMYDRNWHPDGTAEGASPAEALAHLESGIARYAKYSE